MTTPTAYVGGEPLKAYLLRKPCADGGRAGLGRHCQNDHDDCGSLLHPIGIALSFWIMGRTAHPGRLIAAGCSSVGPAAVRDCRIRVRAAARTLYMDFGNVSEDRAEDRLSRSAGREITIRWIERSWISIPHRLDVLCLHRCCFLGWMAEAVEVYVIIWYLGGPAMCSPPSLSAPSPSLSKAAPSSSPAASAPKTAGIYCCLKAFGYSDVDRNHLCAPAAVPRTGLDRYRARLFGRDGEDPAPVRFVDWRSAISC